MTSLTPHRRLRDSPPGRPVVGATLTLLLALGVGACTGDGDEPGGEREQSGATSSEATEAPAVTTTTTLGGVGRGVSDAARERLKADVNAVVDPFFDTGFLGRFPRSDFQGAFASFTRGARADAEGRDLALLSNQAIAEQVDEVTATNRRVRVEVFSHHGRPRGATASFVLDFDTTGALAESRRVVGQLFLSKEKGAWRVFGYDVAPAVTR